MINFYEHFKNKKTHNPNLNIHKIELPFRALINCASGGGKSNLMLNLLYEMDNTFHKIIIVSKASEPLYDFLQDKLNKSTKNNNTVEIYYEGAIPEIEKMKEGKNGIIIFDDMVLTKDNRIGEMFIRGRKLGYSCVYISQSFFGTPKIVRQNVNYIWLGRGISKRDLRLILSEFSVNLSLDEMVKLYHNITKENMNFMMLDFNKRNIRKNIKEIVLEF